MECLHPVMDRFLGPVRLTVSAAMHCFCHLRHCLGYLEPD